MSPQAHSDLETPLVIHSRELEDTSDEAAAPPSPQASEGPAQHRAAVFPELTRAPSAPGECSTSAGVANLITTAVGAGMLALPCAVAKTGILLGGALFLLVAALTFASCTIIVGYAHRWRVGSYGDLVGLHFGRLGSSILQGAIVAHVFGVMIGYNVIIADVLVGSAPCHCGVLPTVLGRHDDPWWLSRPAVLAVLMLTVIVPTLLPRSLHAVAKFSSLSVCMLLVLASSIAGLALVSLARGQIAPDVHVLPTGKHLGKTPFEAANTLLSVVAVAALAFTCQFNLLPIKHSLKDSCQGGMMRVLAFGLASCAVLYATVAVSGYALFGSAVDGDVLKNLTSKFVARLLGHSLAHTLVYGVALSYTLCLLANFVLKVWAVREAVVEGALGRPSSDLPPLPFYTVTYALVALAYLISVLVPSIYGLLALVGSTATVVFSYLFPALVVLKSAPTLAQRGGAGALIGLGGLMAATAIYNHLAGHSLE